MPRNPLGSLLGRLAGALRPSQTLRWTREGAGYIVIWLVLLGTGLYQQINLVLLIAGLAAGPIVASIFVSAAMLRRLDVARRGPRFVFSGEPMGLEYSLENRRGWREALALTASDALSPVEPGSPAARELYPSAFFPRVPAGDRGRQSWRGTAPARGRYRFRTIELVTRSPFGLLERRGTVEAPGELVVYPALGTVTRRWRRVFRTATETRLGRRHDRSAQQQEYHGLRDYRPGDSPRWIHWRTTARLGVPMVKEFEQQSEQDVAILVDPWVPRTRASAGQREAAEKAVRFAATLCLDLCRAQGRRVLLGWTGAAPGLHHGPASTRLLHDLLAALAVLRASPEGGYAALLDAMPPHLLREAYLIFVSTRPVNLAEEIERSTRLGEASAPRLSGRALVLDASRGDLEDYVDLGPSGSAKGPGAEVPGDDEHEPDPADGRPVAAHGGTA